ncbi:MAG: type II toxin-antitoxin system HicA family toxin [Burkholderiaceae bacterium]|nr:type II toxin-antitoxin system HicA family toxin [Burkholderiaceae bacterium]
MSSHHAKTLRLIFQDPPSHNIHWRDVESLLHHVGAGVEPLSGARIRVTKDRIEAVLHRPHHHNNELDKQGLMHLREFLARAGVTLSLYEAGGG